MLKKLDENCFDTIYRIMQESFPINEYRTYAEQKALFKNPLYAVYGWLSPQTGNIQAFIAVWEFETIAFIEHFAVDAKARNGGLGSKMLQQLIAMLQKQVCLEVELPNDDMATRRIGFYQRNGFVLNPYDYMQPSISAGREPIPLKIMTTQNGVDAQTFEQIRTLLYTQVYRSTT